MRHIGSGAPSRLNLSRNLVRAGIASTPGVIFSAPYRILPHRTAPYPTLPLSRPRAGRRAQDLRISYFTPAQFESIVGPIREVFSQQLKGRPSLLRKVNSQR